VPEIFLSVFVPFVFVGLACLTFVLFAFYPVFLFLFIGLFCVVNLIPKTRSYLVQGILDQFILFYAVILYARKKKYRIWEK
jgi:hypothetical protein